jgi:hypothetical protein
MRRLLSLAIEWRIMNETYAVGWLALALINANIAQLKGHSGLGWCLGSLIAGPVATFFLTLTEQKRTPPAAAVA